MWEISQKTLIDMAADRGAYICQSQSFNVFIAEPNFAKLTSMHFYAWKKGVFYFPISSLHISSQRSRDAGLKTGMYYLRSRPAVNAIQFTVDQEALKASNGKRSKEEEEAALMCSLQNKDACLMCSG